MGLGAATANDEGGKHRVDGPGAGAARSSSEQLPPTDLRFNLNALDLNIYGLSYHPDREAVDRLHLDNQVNPGLGVHYELANDRRGITFADAGAYYDSGRNWAKFAALGYQFKLTEHWRMGGAIAVMDSPTYNGGAAVIALIPVVTCDMGRIKLNAVYFPKFSHYNEVAAFGFYISIPVAQWAQ